jgi:hypothetical protein
MVKRASRGEPWGPCAIAVAVIYVLVMAHMGLKIRGDYGAEMLRREAKAVRREKVTITKHIKNLEELNGILEELVV